MSRSMYPVLAERSFEFQIKTYCIVFFLHLLICSRDDGYFMQPKHVAAIGFTIIRVVCRGPASLLMRSKQTFDSSPCPSLLLPIDIKYVVLSFCVYSSL